ncbi:hypothetical protein LP7551_02103 [Roseibium album]|nr:hypothetical protein LP7551_02103 [Roseibium album]
MVSGVRGNLDVLYLQVFRTVVGLLTDIELVVAQICGDVTAIVIAGTILGEQRLSAGDIVGIEGEGNRAVGQIQAVRIAGLQIITPLTGELRVTCNGKDGGHAFG